MNQPLFGGKWGDSVLCKWCQQHMGGPLSMCPKCGCNQESDPLANPGKVIEQDHFPDAIAALPIPGEEK